MKNKILAPFALVLLLFLVACSGKQENKGYDHYVKVSIDNPETFNLSDVADSCFMVPLKSADGVVIGEIKEVFLIDSLIIVWDSKSENLLVYNQSGDYLYQIGRKGEASEEYVYLTNVKIDSENKINISDVSMQRIIRYDLRGNYISSMTMNNPFTNFLPVESGFWGITSFSNKYNLTLVDREGQNEIKTYFYSEESIPLGKVNNFSTDEKGDIIFYVTYKDVIYKIEGEELVPFVEIDFGQKKPEDINTEEFRTFFHDGSYLGAISNVHFYKNKLFFSFADFKGMGKPYNSYRVFVDFNTSEKKSVIYIDGKHFDNVPVDPIPEIVSLTDNKLVYQIVPDMYPEAAIEKIREYFPDISSDSEPILVFYNLKD